MRRSPSPMPQRRSQRRSDTELPWRAARSAGAFPSTGCTKRAKGGSPSPRWSRISSQRLAAQLGLDKLTHDALATAFRTRSAEDWEAWGREHDIPLGVVSSRE